MLEELTRHTEPGVPRRMYAKRRDFQWGVDPERLEGDQHNQSLERLRVHLLLAPQTLEQLVALELRAARLLFDKAHHSSTAARAAQEDHDGHDA